MSNFQDTSAARLRAASEDLFQRLDEEEGEAAGKQWLGR
jgi:hypothetical protein